MSTKYPEPPEYTYVDRDRAEYRGRIFYGQNAHDRAELTWLREWKQWAEAELRSHRAFERSVNDALNSGDGAYRP